MTTKSSNPENTSLAERCAALLEDPGLRRRELDRVMAQHPILTHAGLGWVRVTAITPRVRYQVFHRLPENDHREQEAYREMRELLLHGAMTPEECWQQEREGCRESVHQGEVPLALRYLGLCQHAARSPVPSAEVKRRAQGMLHPRRHCSNGSVIAAALMAGVRVVRQDAGGQPGITAHLHITQPRGCSRENCGGIIPPGSRKRLCDSCRQGE